MLLDAALVLDDVLGASSVRLSPHLGPLPMGEEESSFKRFQVRGVVAEHATKRQLFRAAQPSPRRGKGDKPKCLE